MFGLKRIKELEQKNESLVRTLDREIERRNNLEKKVDKLYRLLKHHDKFTEVSYTINHTYNWLSSSNDEPELCIYIDDEEYVVKLSELRFVTIKRESIEIKKGENDGFVVFRINNYDDTTQYEFTIEYETGKYICVKRRIEEEREESDV